MFNRKKIQVKGSEYQTVDARKADEYLTNCANDARNKNSEIYRVNVLPSSSINKKFNADSASLFFGRYLAKRKQYDNIEAELRKLVVEFDRDQFILKSTLAENLSKVRSDFFNTEKKYNNFFEKKGDVSLPRDVKEKIIELKEIIVKIKNSTQTTDTKKFQTSRAENSILRLLADNKSVEQIKIEAMEEILYKDYLRSHHQFISLTGEYNSYARQIEAAYAFIINRINVEFGLEKPVFFNIKQFSPVTVAHVSLQA